MVKTLNHAYALVLLLAGASLLFLGSRLALLGGSPWYLLSGGVLTGCSILCLLRRGAAPWVYWSFLMANFLWAIWEVGFSGWALAPRLVMPTLLGLWMLTPWFRSHVGISSPLPGGRVLWPSLGAACLILLAVPFWLNRLPPAQSVALGPPPGPGGEADWIAFGNDRGGSRWSGLSQITASNVGNLQRAWVFHTGLSSSGHRATFEANPLKIGSLVYVCTGSNDVVAVDADTGRQVWRYSPHVDERGTYALTCRGVAYYKVPGAAGLCAARIYTATIDARLIALDAASGRLCPSFGRSGQVDLLKGMGHVDKGYYYVTSPPAVVRGRLVLGGWVTDGQYVGEPAGVVRAFDAVTGEFAWAFDPERPDHHEQPAGEQIYSRGSPNSWAPMSSDEKLGLVFVPTGNATPDYFGGHRTPNDDRFSSAVVALDADTGDVRWSFQTTHHDLWDYDVGSQPTLADMPDGTPGLIQATKRGQIFILDRRTGRPLFPVRERKVPQGGVPGERIAPTQPYSTGLPAFTGARPTESNMWGLTPIDQAICRIRFRQARFDGDLTPLGVDRSTVVWPGNLGGMDWGSVAVDKKRALVVVNNNNIAMYDRLMTRDQANQIGLKPISLHNKGEVGGPVAQQGTPFAAIVAPFLSALKIPCQQPPYGMISAFSLRTGQIVWSHPIGTSRDSGPFNLPVSLPIPMGVPNIGGALVTSTGVVFIGATQEHAFRAYDVRSGRELWRARLPAGAQANPSTYWSSRSGRQFVVIAVGGHPGMRSGSSDQLIAYALPRR